MNIRQLLVPFGMALLTTWAIQYFFFGNKDQKSMQTVKSGQSFVAPVSSAEYKPLIREIDFIDAKRTSKKELTTFETPLATYVFSSDGACLHRFEVKREISGKASSLTTIFPLPETEKETRCFLLARNEKTPYYYRLLDVQEEAGLSSVTYGYDTDDITIIKKYTIFTDSYRVDLETTIEPKSNSPETLRLVFPSPLMPDIISSESINGIVAGMQGSLQKIPVGKIKPQEGWFAPAIFGTDSKYFAHAMIADVQGLVQRGYYADNQPRLISYLESKPITEKVVWNLSFYLGPKEYSALTTVDQRLDQVLDYSGWLAPIAKIALALLNWLYGYLKNYGWAIVALTVLMRLLLIPFSWRAQEGEKKAAEYKKKLQYLQQKYKHDPELLAQEKTELFKKHGMPGLSGCLPMLVQVPLFFALNRVLSSSIELYKAPFIGWITDLSATDPYYILPALLVVTMLLQGVLMDAQKRFMVIGMALVFGAVSINFASGLCLYILVSTLLSVGQSAWQRRS